MRNRGITRGCAQDAYCPNDLVTRLSKAAFMHRLGTVLTPVDLDPVVAPAAPVALGAGALVCSTPVIQTAGYPARAYVTMLATLSAPTAAGVGVKSEVVYSTRGGAWVAVANSDQYTTLYGGATPPQEVATAPFAVFDLPPNANVSVALRLSRVAGAGDITAACANRIQIANRNGNASPF